MTCVNNKLEFFLKLRPVKTSLFKVDIMNFLRKMKKKTIVSLYLLAHLPYLIAEPMTALTTVYKVTE